MKNYVTPKGYQFLKASILKLLNETRPDLVKTIQWAASNGDRSENGDYIYGKKRLRAIDREIRYLTKKLETSVIVDPKNREATKQVFFGATVTLSINMQAPKKFSVVGIDEADPKKGYISWISPLARTIIKAREGDQLGFKSEAGQNVVKILKVEYLEIK